MIRQSHSLIANTKLDHLLADLAQMVERCTCNADVVGSKPAIGTIFGSVAD